MGVGVSGQHRSMPSLYKVASYWIDHARFPDYLGNYYGLGEPFCARCHFLAPVQDGEGAWGRAGHLIERAHLVDRMYGGPDTVDNLIPLCWRCHRSMPSFRPGQEEESLAWVRDYHATMGNAEHLLAHAMGMAPEGSTKSGLDRKADLLLLEMANLSRSATP